MPIRVYYEVLNQKGSPAVYADNYAQRPAAGFTGRIFYSPDTAQIFYDTGSTWTLLADAGVGSGSLASVCANGNTTATGISITAGGLSSNSITNTSNTAGSVLFAGAGGAESQSNATFFWDNTNKRLGLGNAAPGVTLDVHGTGTLVQLNGTGANNAFLQFQNAGVSKWRIGNLYNAGANTFQIYNNALANYAMQIDSSSNSTFIGSVTSNSFVAAATGITLTNGGTTTTAGATNIGGLTAGLNIALASGFNQTLTFPTGVAYTYTFPSATGTLALTSNLSSYLPLAGGTLTGGLTINSTLYINPTNTGLTGLDVASDSISFRSDNLEGSKRQLLLQMGSGTLIQFTAQGYGAARGTDVAYYTSSASGVNASPAIYMTGGNKVGFGTGSPSATIHIVAGTNTPYQILDSSTAGYCFSDYRYNNTTYGYVGAGSSITGGGSNTDMAIVSLANLVFGAGSTTEGMRLTTARNLMIGTSTDTGRKLYVLSGGNTSASYCSTFDNSSSTTLFSLRNDGLFQTGTAANSPYNASITGRNAVIDSSGTLGYLVSTRESKDNIQPLSSVDWINKLNPVSFNYRKKDNDMNYTNDLYDYKSYGFIADEVEKVNSDLVFYTNFEDGTKKLAGVEYNNIIAVLVKAVQELNDKIENLN